MNGTDPSDEEGLGEWGHNQPETQSELSAYLDPVVAEEPALLPDDPNLADAAAVANHPWNDDEPWEPAGDVDWVDVDSLPRPWQLNEADRAALDPGPGLGELDGFARRLWPAVEHAPSDETAASTDARSAELEDGVVDEELRRAVRIARELLAEHSAGAGG